MLCLEFDGDRSRMVAVGPTVWVGKKAHGLSFYWYIATGDKALDKKIVQIAIDEAKNF